MASYRLGLDLGTNSIGWCALKLDSQGKPKGVLATGVRLLTPNQEAGKDPQSKTSLAADRRAARSARRRRDRFLRRQKRLMEVLISHGLMPADEVARKALENRDPYEIRARAIREEITAHELGRALFHINQRRGFKSNRIADSDDSEKGAVKEGVKALREKLKAEGAETLGDLLWKWHKDRRQVRFRPTAQGNKVLYDFYPHRDFVEHEIDTIWKFQKAYHRQLTDDLLSELKRIIIAQRPLKKPAIGRCTFRPDEERAPRALPLFQRFRILQDIASLRIEKIGHDQRPLTMAEHDRLVRVLSGQASQVKFEKIRKELKLTDEERLNYEGKTRKGFDPDLTAAKLSAAKVLGKTWRAFDRAKQTDIVERLLTEEDEDALLEWLQTAHGLTPEQAEKAAQARLPQGHAHLGRSVLVELVAVMESEPAVDEATGEVLDAPLTYDAAVRRLGLHHSDLGADGQLPELPYYGDVLKSSVIEKPDAPEDSQERRGRVPNPTVHIALNQTRKLINALIAEYGKPAQIHIELARDLKLSAKAKEERNREIAENTRANEKRKEKLAELKQDDNGENRLRLRLYEEMPIDERVCVYTGKMIGCRELFSAEVEIDHILPFSQTLDDSFTNKVLSTREANRRKGNRPPSEAFSSSELEDMHARALRLFKRKAWRFAPDAMTQFEENGGWQARHLTDTQHMARLTRTYLQHVCPDVVAIPGRMTAMLRGLWGLNSILPDHNRPRAGAKDRGDHRHHAVDAFVVACTERGILNRISHAAGKAEDLNLSRLFEKDGMPKPWEGYREEFQTKLESVIISHKPDHGHQGQLHEETAYGRVDEEIDGKRYNLVTRRPILALKEAEIGRVRDPDWRAQLQDVAAAAKRDKRKLPDALADFVQNLEQREGRTIRHIRVLKTEKDTITVQHNGFEKAYIPGDNHRIEIFQNGNGDWDGEAVSIFEANQEKRRQSSPGNTASGSNKTLVMRVHKGDLIEADFEGVRKVYRVYRLEPSAKRMRLAEHNESGTLDARHKEPDDPFRWVFASYAKLQAAGARRVHVDVLGRVTAVKDLP